MNDMQNVSRLIQDRQNKFIETRTIIENEVNRFLQSLAAMDADVQQRCGYQPGLDAKQLLSALWTEPFDEAKYAVQLENFNRYVNQAKMVCDEINKEALACLQS